MVLMQDYRLDRKVTLKYTPIVGVHKNARDSFNSIILSKSKLSLTLYTKFITTFLIQKNSFSYSLFSPGKPHSRKTKKKNPNISKVKHNHCIKMKISSSKLVRIGNCLS